MKGTLMGYYAALPEGAMPNFVFGNHDIHRLATRFGVVNHRSAAMLLLTLRGLPIIYNGDELGMENTVIPVDRLQDPVGKANPESPMARDPERTPIQWDATANAGFSAAGVQTWLPVAENYRKVNVAVQREDPTSTLNFYKALIKLRGDSPALHHGDIQFIEDMPEDILAYTRHADGQRFLVVINFGDDTHTLDLSTVGEMGIILLSTKLSPLNRADLKALSVDPHESILISFVSVVEAEQRGR